jgi:hypothetical protein
MEHSRKKKKSQEQKWIETSSPANKNATTFVQGRGVFFFTPHCEILFLAPLAAKRSTWRPNIYKKNRHAISWTYIFTQQNNLQMNGIAQKKQRDKR